MGKATDETNTLKEEKKELREEIRDLKKDKWMQVGRYAGYFLLGLTAVYGATKDGGEIVAKKAKQDVRAVYQDNKIKIIALQKYAEANQKEIQAIRQDVKVANGQLRDVFVSELNNMRSFMEGVLLARRGPSLGSSKDIAQAKEDLLKKETELQQAQAKAEAILKKSRIVTSYRPKLHRPEKSFQELVRKQTMQSQENVAASAK